MDIKKHQSKHGLLKRDSASIKFGKNGNTREQFDEFDKFVQEHPGDLFIVLDDCIEEAKTFLHGAGLDTDEAPLTELLEKVEPMSLEDYALRVIRHARVVKHLLKTDDAYGAAYSMGLMMQSLYHGKALDLEDRLHAGSLMYDGVDKSVATRRATAAQNARAALETIDGIKHEHPTWPKDRVITKAAKELRVTKRTLYTYEKKYRQKN